MLEPVYMFACADTIPSVRTSVYAWVCTAQGCFCIYVCINKCICSIYASRMLVCSGECTSVCMRACPHVFVCACVCARKCTCPYIRTGVRVCACMHACLRIFMHVCTHICECVCLGVHGLWHVCQSRLFLISNFLLLISNLHVCMLT